MDVVAPSQSAIEIAIKLRALAKSSENSDLRMLLADLSNDRPDANLVIAEQKIKVASLIDEK